MTDYNVFALRARLARVNRTEDRPIDGPPLIEFEWDDDSPVTFRDLATLDAYVQEAIAAAFRKRDEALAAVRERDEALAAVERVRALLVEYDKPGGPWLLSQDLIVDDLRAALGDQS